MEIEHLNDENFYKKTQSDKLVVVDFFATWCGPCQILGPILSSVADEQTDVQFFKVDVDQCPITSKKFGVMSIPTLVFLKNGKELTHSVGLISHDDIEDLIEQNK